MRFEELFTEVSVVEARGAQSLEYSSTLQVSSQYSGPWTQLALSSRFWRSVKKILLVLGEN